MARCKTNAALQNASRARDQLVRRKGKEEKKSARKTKRENDSG